LLTYDGLAGYSVHELIEYYGKTGIQMGWLAEPAYALNIPSDSQLHHKGMIGSIFAATFGYTVSPEWARVIVHLAYQATMLPLVVWIYKKGKRA